MSNLTFEKTFLFAKIIAYAMGDKIIRLTKFDKEIACKVLEKICENRSDWTEEKL